MPERDERIQIDILTDSVNDIMDKLFFEATGGKTIDYAWDAPQPAVVNPLSASEASDWGQTAMSFTVSRIANNPRRIGSRRVSDLPRFAQRATSAPFFGYKSDRPTPPAYGVREPVGPVAKAMVAAGELVALAKANGEDPEPIYALLQGSFGIDLRTVSKMVEPDVSNISERDLVKFIRPLNHMLFGFNSVAPTVGVTTGSYRPETMTRPVLFDWHAMLISLRFIGESVVRFNSPRLEPGQAVYFAPAFAEARAIVGQTFASNIVPVVARPAAIELQRAVSSTMRFLQIANTEHAAAAASRAERRNIVVNVDNAIPLDKLADLAGRSRTVSYTLQKNVAKYNELREVHEINNAEVITFRESIMTSGTRFKGSVVLDWKKVFLLLTATVFSNGTAKAAELISIMRLRSKLPAMTEKETATVAHRFAMAFPKGYGYTYYTLLSNMLADRNDAIVEFYKMIMYVKGEPVSLITTSYNEAFTMAVTASKNLANVMEIINTAYSAYSGRTMGFTAILQKLDLTQDLHYQFQNAINVFFHDRGKYWANFYRSVVVDCRNKIKTLKHIAKSRRQAVTTGTYVSAVDTIVIGSAEYAHLSVAALSELVDETVEKMVKANFSADAYARATITVGASFETEFMLSSMQLRQMLKKQARSYADKRRMWGKALGKAADKWINDNMETRLDTLTRHTDMLKFVDDHFEPKVTWKSMFDLMLEKFKLSSRSVHKMFRAYTTNDPTDIPDATVIEREDQEKLDPKMFQGNRYSVLMDSDSSSSSSETEETGAEVDAMVMSDDVSVTYDDNNDFVDDHISINKAETATAPSVPSFAAFGSTIGAFGGLMSTGPIARYKPGEFSLRDYSKERVNHGIYVTYFRRFLEFNGIHGDDYLCEYEELEEKHKDFLDYVSNQKDDYKDPYEKSSTDIL